MLDADERQPTDEPQAHGFIHRHRGAILVLAVAAVGLSGSQFLEDTKALQGGIASLFAGAIGVIQLLLSKQKTDQKEVTVKAAGDVSFEVMRLAIRLGRKVDRIGKSLSKKHRQNQGKFDAMFEQNKRYDQMHEAHAADIAALKKGQQTVELTQAHMGETLEKVNRDVGRIMGKMGLDSSKDEPDTIPLRPDSHDDDSAETA